MLGPTCFLASPSPEALGRICHPYLEVCQALLYPESLEQDQYSELSEALCKSAEKVKVVMCSICKSSHSLGNRMVINAYQGFEDVKLYRNTKFRKSSLKATVQRVTGQYCTLSSQRKSKHNKMRRCSSHTTLISLTMRAWCHPFC